MFIIFKNWLYLIVRSKVTFTFLLQENIKEFKESKYFKP